MAMRRKRAEKERIAVGLLIEERLSRMNATLSGVVVGLTVLSKAASPTIGISCSLRSSVRDRSIKSMATYMVITTATAVTNPRRRARLRITSMKPRRANPSRKVKRPT